MPNLPPLPELVSELIGIPSVTSDKGACRAVIEFVKTVFADLPGIEIREYERNDCASIVLLYKADLEPDILLQAHLDVVPAPNSMFRSEIRDGKIFGRGAFDMKGHAAVLMHCFEKHVRSKSAASLGLMLTTDEEVGGSDGVGYLVDEIGYRPQCVVLPDGGQNFRLVVQQYGIIWAQITRKGISAHSSRPEEGKNAVLSFMESFRLLQRKLSSMPDTILTLSKIEAGAAYNMIPGECRAGIDIRSAHVGQAGLIVRDVFKEEEMLILEEQPSFNLRTDHPVVEQFQQAAKHVLGHTLPEALERGASDGRYFSPHGIPVMLTAADGAGLHQDCEWVTVDSLHQLEKIIGRFIENFKPDTLLLKSCVACIEPDTFALILLLNF